jgi:hypothetical protein
VRLGGNTANKLDGSHGVLIQDLESFGEVFRLDAVAQVDYGKLGILNPLGGAEYPVS